MSEVIFCDNRWRENNRKKTAITWLEEKVDWVKEIKTFRNKVVDGKVAYTREENETPLSFVSLRVMLSGFL